MIPIILEAKEHSNTIPQRVIIITGMHRSGTSLVASMIQKAGVNIGDRLLPPEQGNPRGYFEDVDFYEFQDRVLHRMGHAFLAQAATFSEWLPSELTEARALIAARQDRVMWGWKDPRTSLFLDEWHALVSQPRYLMVYRPPIELAISLL